MGNFGQPGDTYVVVGPLSNLVNKVKIQKSPKIQNQFHEKNEHV